MTQAEAVAGALASMSKLKELHRRQADLMAEFERGLAVKSLWGEAFDHGACRSGWIGAPLTREASRRLYGRHNGVRYALRLRVTNGAGESREWPQAEVPTILWPCIEPGVLP